jgi:hypothetical protein
MGTVAWALMLDALRVLCAGPDDTHCGECHQIQVMSVEKSGVWIPDFKQLIVQVRTTFSPPD